MLRNIIIVSISLGVLSWCAYVFWNRNRYTLSKKIFVLGCFVLWFLTTVLFNIPVLRSPLTPAVDGKVIDAETKQPVAGCNIKAYWEIESGIADRHMETYYQYITKTDGKGNFSIPRHAKVLGLYGVFPIIMSRYGGVKIVAYAHGFRHEISGIRPDEISAIIDYTPSARVTEAIYLGKSRAADLTNDLYTLSRILESDNLPSGTTSDDKKFLQQEYYYYYEHISTIFKGSSPYELRSSLITFASTFGDLGDIQKAIEVYQRLKKEYPDSAKFVDTKINDLQISMKKNGLGASAYLYDYYDVLQTNVWSIQIA